MKFRQCPSCSAFCACWSTAQKNKTRFLILGSASPDLVKNVSETLGGRVEFVELSGFGLHETGTGSANVVWLRGGFPRSFLARSDGDSLAWREGFIQNLPDS